MKKTAFHLLALLAALLTLTSCGSQGPMVKEYYTYFDTVTRIYCYGGISQSEFDAGAEMAAGTLEKYHKYFDIYHRYSGMTNLCDLNENAGGEPMPVDPELFEFLEYTLELYEETKGWTNVMLGSVLSLWHDCRVSAADGEARLPSEEQLQEAAKHTAISLLELDRENMTARIADPSASIDVGAVGKGYAVERAAEALKTLDGWENYVIDVGGNVRMLGGKPDGTPYRTAVTDPFDAGSEAAILELEGTSCVTSGVYQRYFEVGGVKYHHVIDPDTLYPADFYASVTVVAEDSGLADGLSTALMCMDPDEAMSFYYHRYCDFEALFITNDGEQIRTPGLEISE